MQRKVIRKTHIYNQDDTKRGDAPIGMLIEGRQEGTRWVCVSTMTYPATIKIGWWVSFLDTVALTAPLPDPTIHLTHTIEVYDDGSIKVDGNPVS